MTVSKDVVLLIYMIGAKYRVLQPLHFIRLKQTSRFFKAYIDKHMWPMISSLWYDSPMSLSELLVYRASQRYYTNITLRITQQDYCFFTLSGYTCPRTLRTCVCINMVFTGAVRDPFPQMASDVSGATRIYYTGLLSKSEVGKTYTNNHVTTLYLLKLISPEIGWYIYDAPSAAYLR